MGQQSSFGEIAKVQFYQLQEFRSQQQQQQQQREAAHTAAAAAAFIPLIVVLELLHLIVFS
jgi:hypothetical protein